MRHGAARTSRRHDVSRVGAIVAALVGLAFVAAACSSTGVAPGVASLGATTTTLSAGATGANGGLGALGTTNLADAEKFAQCMRAHGVPNWPDPDSDGNFVIAEPKLGVSQAVQNRANTVCQHLLPNGGQPSAQQQQAFLAQGLRLASCMRANGVTDFPDPVDKNGQITIRLGGKGVDPSSAAFRRAVSACAEDFPGGKPPPAQHGGFQAAGS